MCNPWRLKVIIVLALHRRYNTVYKETAGVLSNLHVPIYLCIKHA